MSVSICSWILLLFFFFFFYLQFFCWYFFFLPLRKCPKTIYFFFLFYLSLFPSYHIIRVTWPIEWLTKVLSLLCIPALRGSHLMNSYRPLETPNQYNTTLPLHFSLHLRTPFNSDTSELVMLHDYASSKFFFFGTILQLTLNRRWLPLMQICKMQPEYIFALPPKPQN